MSRAAVPLATVLMPSHACTTAGDKTSDMMALASFSSRFRRVNASQPNHSSCPLVLSNLQGGCGEILCGGFSRQQCGWCSPTRRWAKEGCRASPATSLLWKLTGTLEVFDLPILPPLRYYSLPLRPAANTPPKQFGGSY